MKAGAFSLEICLKRAVFTDSSLVSHAAAFGVSSSFSVMKILFFTSVHLFSLATILASSCVGASSSSLTLSTLSCFKNHAYSAPSGINFTEPKSWITGNAMVITPLKDEILKKFLVFILPFANIKQVITGSAQPQITRTNLSQLQIPLPPLIIQKQIVDECEKVEKEYQKIRMSIEEYRNLIKAVLEKCGVISSAGGGIAKLLDFIADVDLKAQISSLPTPPNTGWEMTKLGQICEIIRGVTYQKTEQSLSRSNKIVLTADNITLDNKFEIYKMIYLNENMSLDENKKLKQNDIFMCFASGSLKHIGKVAFISQDTEFYAGGFMGILRGKNVKSKFLFTAIASDEFKIKLENSATGSNINNLSSKIAYLQIPLPPLKDQEKIVSVIENLENKIEKFKSDLNALASKNQEILQKYLFSQNA